MQNLKTGAIYELKTKTRPEKWLNLAAHNLNLHGGRNAIVKVKCESTYPSDEQLWKLGPTFYPGQTFGITTGKEYLVLGLSFEVNSKTLGTGIAVDLLSDSGYFVSVPLCLFEITDSRASRLWELRRWEDGTVTLWPPSFYAQCFVDDYNADAPKARSELKRVVALLELESST